LAISFIMTTLAPFKPATLNHSYRRNSLQTFPFSFY
jgi:hypothetical protein